ncbi:MAG: peptidylprolyl isomerase [Gemmataceae bacterium]|nr:peptidylprolyl isomerase [Gemmataceae bacterium]
MTERRGKRRTWRVRVLASAGMMALALTGCGKPAEPGNPADPGETAPSSPTPVESPATPAPHSRYDLPFDDAVTTQAPEGSQAPVAQTLTGESTARLHLAIRDAWPGIRLTDDAGKPSPIAVALDTDAGPVEITLFPEYAPNHVRNFLALARVGYYNGLVFERVIRQELISDGGTKHRVEVVTAGCPVGDGEAGSGHLGYFLRPELSGLSHDEGTVGFVRAGDPNSACCRFYVCLTPAPILDGQYTSIGKVTQGLEVVRAIAARPVKDPATYPESEQPRTPAKIRRVGRK